MPVPEWDRGRLHRPVVLPVSSSGRAHCSERAREYFEQSLALFRKSVGERDQAFLTAQDDFCRFLLLQGQHERCLELQKASLPCKRALFGDLSAEVADALQLMGSVEMTRGKLLEAYRTMTECLEVQSILFGPQHKKTKAIQKAVDMLARTSEVADGPQRRDKTKVHTCSPSLSSTDPDRRTASEF